MSQHTPIVVRELNHSYGRGALAKQVLFDVSTTIPSGEIVIMTGPSGSGKTTLLTLVGALRSAQSGSVQVLGRELSGARAAALEAVRRQIGFIFQQHNLLDALTAQQNVELGLRVARQSGWREPNRHHARDMLAAVGLAEHLHRKPAQLSGGQRQRVAIARALVGEPSILLADEPTASLDRHSGREVVDRMQTLARERGTTILLVTHDNRILDIADRVIHLEDGRLETFTESVIANTQHLMHTLAENQQKRALDPEIAAMDDATFHNLLTQLTNQSRQFIEATQLAEGEAFRSLLERALRAFTQRVAAMLNAERASLLLVDRATNELVVAISQDLPRDANVRFALDKGIAGAVVRSGKTLRLDDAYADPRFNPEIDAQTGFRTRSILCIPLIDRDGAVFGVTQLLNRRDGHAFKATDELRFAEFATSFAVILETLHRLNTHRSDRRVQP